MTLRISLILPLAAALAALALPAAAQDKFTYMTNWYAQAEQGGFYQAQADGLYRQHGLDVTLRMGGPQVNAVQVMASGQADCVMGSTDIQMMQLRESGIPLVTVAAFFQKDPSVLIAHADVSRVEDLKGKTLMIAAQSGRSFWPWLKARYGFTDAQTRPYTFNVQPFLADPDAAQQGYLTSEPFAIEQAGVKARVMLLADLGFPAYATTVTCLEQTLQERPKQVAAFVKASAEGWKRYLANPAAGNALIRKDNPAMTDAQLAYSLGRLKDTGMVTGGDAATQGIGILTDARARASHEFLVASKLLDPAKVPLAKTYSTAFVKDAKVLP
jgi:NitT/TauT family transport system substrate-binding protein